MQCIRDNVGDDTEAAATDGTYSIHPHYKHLAPAFTRTNHSRHLNQAIHHPAFTLYPIHTLDTLLNDHSWTALSEYNCCLHQCSGFDHLLAPLSISAARKTSHLLAAALSGSPYCVNRSSTSYCKRLWTLQIHARDENGNWKHRRMKEGYDGVETMSYCESF